MGKDDPVATPAAEPGADSWPARVWTDLGRRDPQRSALRRGARVAVTAPVAVVTCSALFGEAALFGVFAVIALLVFSDFGGNWRDRTLAYLGTAAVGIPILLVGAGLGDSVPGAMAVMGVVALPLGLLAVLRGFLPGAQTTLLLCTVLAVTSSPPGQTWSAVGSWVLGGLLATAAALLLWPIEPSHQLERQLAQLLHAFAADIREQWGGATETGGARAGAAGITPARTGTDDGSGRLGKDGSDTPHPRGTSPAGSTDSARHPVEDDGRRADAVAQALEQLDGSYAGDLQRPSGLTRRDRALADLVRITARLRAIEEWAGRAGSREELANLPAGLAAADAPLAESVSGLLDASAQRITGAAVPLDSRSVARAQEDHLIEVSRWVEQEAGLMTGPRMRDQLEALFGLRAASLAARRIATHVLSTATPERDDGPAGAAPAGATVRVRAHLSGNSPWFRTAVRSAVALAVSVGVAVAVGAGHEFWVVLGTLAALRFDALGTGRTALQAVAGTAVGVTIALALTFALPANSVIWFFLLPPALFIAAYTPGTFSFTTGQAGFTVAVLILFAALNEASSLTAELRLLDVTMGVLVSAVVSVLLWPRGVTATLYSRTTESVDAAADYLAAAVDRLCGGAVDQRRLDGLAARSARATDRCYEASDLALASRPPRQMPMRQWAQVAGTARNLHDAAGMLERSRRLLAERGWDRLVPEPLVAPLLDAGRDVQERLRSAVGGWDREQRRTTDPGEAGRVLLPLPPVRAPSPAVRHLREAMADYLVSGGPTGPGLRPPDAHPALMSWTTDWMLLIDWNATVLEQDLSRTR